MLALAILATVALAQGGPQVTPPKWGDDTTFEFAIYNKDARVATAYYRILKEKALDQDVYRFKYVGRNAEISESTECVVDAKDMQPLRSTRKVVYGNKTFYQDSGYREGGVVLREKYEGGTASEKSLPSRGQAFDYEELIWLIPQLDLPDNGRAQFDVFSMIVKPPVVTPVLLTQTGYQDVTVQGKKYHARVYSFSVGMTPYKYFMVMQAGKPTPARIDMAGTRFENLKLDPKKVTKFPQYTVAKPSTAPANQLPQPDQQQDQNPPARQDELTPYLPPPPGQGQ